ncbi:uncharacterized protein LOC130636895 [Hydractinia symbiolongicarpus]|uniref:uncharacterized protein LOC130636895 n=1 Tax=Hydractinia symbiolongicarpus TaxID=13093 RepID=UPI00254C86A3|nr:uncharacterized protein LOC130636895 [Hydractinia symbiolongicarpus]
MGEYHDLYLKSDVLLLADVFENFRSTCLEYYKLDPAHYYTSPGLSWDAMLRMTDVELELYAKSNNKYTDDYNPDEKSKYIMCLNANNLYGHGTSQYLPTGGFRWFTKNEIKKCDLANYETDSKKGLIFEVDFEYPKELHDIDNDYPLAPERMNVTKNMLSKYCKKIQKKYNILIGDVKKLIPTLHKKEKYVVHCRNLELYISSGLKVKKVDRILEFDQSPWLKQYIDSNTNKRTFCKNAFEKDFFKLMNNSVFGKTMENIRKRVNVELVTNKKKLMKLTSKPTFESSKIFNENLVAVHKIKETLTLNRPAYVGMCILDLSKTMYDFHYYYIKHKYKNDAKLLFTDTDSLTYETTTDDAYMDFWGDRDKFDNSDYPESSQFYNTENKKIVGKMKDEAEGVPILEFVGLKSRMYNYIKDNGKSGKTAKGVKKNILRIQ